MKRMKSGMKYKQRDIVIVPFPFSDLSSIKRRPVLILSRTQDIENSDDIVTCGITSRLNNSKYSILVEDNNLTSGFLPRPSRIKIDKLFTIDKSIIIKKIATIDRSIFEQVKLVFRELV